MKRYTDLSQYLCLATSIISVTPLISRLVSLMPGLETTKHRSSIALLLLLGYPICLFGGQTDATSALAVKLGSFKTDTERYRIVEANRPLVTPELDLALEAEGDRKKLSGDYEQALSVYSFLHQLSVDIHDRSGEAGGLRGMGAAQYYLGNYDAAIRYLKQSLVIRRELEDRLGAARILGALGAVQYSLGNYTEALSYSQETASSYQELGDETQSKDVLNNIGLIYQDLGEYDLALKFHLQSLAMKQKLKDNDGMSASAINIGNIYFSRGNYKQALASYQEALALCRSMGSQLCVANGLNNIGGVYLSEGNLKAALKFQQEALAVRKSTGEKLGMALSYGDIGNIFSELGLFSKALEYEYKSLALRRELRQPRGIGLALGHLGEVYRDIGDFGRSRYYLLQAIDEFDKNGIRPELATSLADLAALNLRSGDPRSALTSARRAVAISQAGGYFDSLWRAQSTAGEAHERLNEAEDAARFYSDAIGTIESGRFQVSGGEEERVHFFEDKTQPYMGQLRLLASRGDAAAALGFAERSRARVLLDVLQSGRETVTKAMTSEEKEAERTLNREISSLNGQLARQKTRPQPDNVRILELAASLDQSRLKLEVFQGEIYSKHPELKIQRGTPVPLNLEVSASELLDRRSAFLEYAVTERKTFLFVVRKAKDNRSTRVEVFAIPLSRKSLALRVETLRSQLAERDLSYRVNSANLFSLLIGPAQASLSGITRLIIIPDKQLWNLPFQALTSSQGHYLIQDFAVSYAPSIGVLREMVRSHQRDRSKQESRGMLLAFGNPVSSQLEPGNQESLGANIAPDSHEALMETERQVLSLGRLYGQAHSRVYVGENATEQRFKRESSGYRVVHIATHGVLDNRSPMYSYVLLSPSPNGDDGYLEAREILNLDLKADLVVLSACETARGKIGTGEGVTGLAWALFVAGAPASILSQWKVDSASTSDLMLEFHSHLRQTMEQHQSDTTLAELLRLAVLKTMKDPRYGHPFYWSPFVLIGDPSIKPH